MSVAIAKILLKNTKIHKLLILALQIVLLRILARSWYFFDGRYTFLVSNPITEVGGMNDRGRLVIRNRMVVTSAGD